MAHIPIVRIIISKAIPVLGGWNEIDLLYSAHTKR